MAWTDANQNLRRLIIKDMAPDICCLVETHLNEDKVIKLDGYKTYYNNRKTRHNNAVIIHGGIAVLVKYTFLTENRIHVIENDIDGLLILEIEDKVSKYKQLICLCYVAPENSVWNNRDEIFEAITTCI